MTRLERLAIRLDNLASEMDPFDYESNISYHKEILVNDPLDIIDQLLDIINEKEA